MKIKKVEKQISGTKYIISFIIIVLIVSAYFWLWKRTAKNPGADIISPDREQEICEFKAGGKWYQLEVLEKF